MASSTTQIVPEINITPLVDVVLVLLIIFMVIAPQMQKGQPVAMAEVGHPDAEAKGQFDPITISVTKDGTIWYEKDKIGMPALALVFAEIKAKSPDRKVILQADRSVAFKHVRRVFAAAQDAGVSGVSLKVSVKKVEG